MAISPKQVEIARRLLAGFPETTMDVGDIDHLGLPDEHFDAVVNPCFIILIWSARSRSSVAC